MEVAQEAESLVKPLSFDKEVKNKFFWTVALVFILGLVSGWGIFCFTTGKEASFDKSGRKMVQGEKAKKGESYGLKDSVFIDSATGVVEKNTEGGDGTHRLLREGGESQTAFLTSSVVDLDLFVGRKIEVWGQTFSSEEVGWLMDVGQVKVLE